MLHSVRLTVSFLALLALQCAAQQHAACKCSAGRPCMVQQSGASGAGYADDIELVLLLQDLGSGLPFIHSLHRPISHLDCIPLFQSRVFPHACSGHGASDGGVVDAKTPGKPPLTPTRRRTTDTLNLRNNSSGSGHLPLFAAPNWSAQPGEPPGSPSSPFSGDAGLGQPGKLVKRFSADGGGARTSNGLSQSGTSAAGGVPGSMESRLLAVLLKRQSLGGDSSSPPLIRTLPSYATLPAGAPTVGRQPVQGQAAPDVGTERTEDQQAAQSTYVPLKQRSRGTGRWRSDDGGEAWRTCLGRQQHPPVVAAGWPCQLEYFA